MKQTNTPMSSLHSNGQLLLTLFTQRHLQVDHILLNAHWLTFNFEILTIHLIAWGNFWPSDLGTDSGSGMWQRFTQGVRCLRWVSPHGVLQAGQVGDGVPSSLHIPSLAIMQLTLQMPHLCTLTTIEIWQLRTCHTGGGLALASIRKWLMFLSCASYGIIHLRCIEKMTKRKKRKIKYFNYGAEMNFSIRRIMRQANRAEEITFRTEPGLN